jgi:serine/threonine protein kinase
MTLAAGSRLGPYEIVAPLGAGGMGEVYRARDTRLDRAVAIKILPADFAKNGQLKIRFECEAKTISQLSHPNICTLFDVGDNYLVMELLEGETLADRLWRGPLPLADVLKFGIQIADALGRAHRAGIVHRDLKPANVMLTKSGAKLLDFGLAKTTSGIVDMAGPTQHKALTQEGTIVGTFQYMAPEQLEGAEADARTDIFALGAVLYEMTTGKRAFDGKTKTSLIAAIVSGQPRPLSEMQPLTPSALEHVVKKCLEKDPDARWQSAQDVAEELRWIGEGQSTARVRSAAASWPLIAAAAVLALVIGTLIGAWTIIRRRPPERITYSEINPPEKTGFVFDNSPAVLSPDGSKIVYVARPKDGAMSLYVRPLDKPDALALRGTENALFPFWSPDSRVIGFFADGRLKRIAASGGSIDTLAPAATGRGGSWAGETMIFAPTPGSALYQIPASGGEVKPLTQLNVDRGDTSHRLPVFLPDGRHFLAFVQGISEGANILLGSIDGTENRMVLSADGGVSFAPPDTVLFVRDRALRAQRMDMKTFRMIGEPTPLAERVQASSSLNFANFSVSTNGLLTYVSGASATLTVMTFFDVKGKQLGSVGEPAEQLDPRVSPDGHAVACARSDANGSQDVWAVDLRRNVTTRLTFSPANEFGPVWAPDSKVIVYTSFDKRPGDLFVKRVEGTGPGEPLLVDKRRKIASQWTADGKYIIYHALTPGSTWDVEALSIADKKTIRLVHGPASEVLGYVSPDGHWLAYASDESGKTEIFVQAFPDGGGRWQISGGGGTMPIWSPDGHELYYVSSDSTLMAAAVRVGRTFEADTPRVLFTPGIRLVTGVTRRQYDVSRDGRFLINMNPPETQAMPGITLVQNWKAKLPQ